MIYAVRSKYTHKLYEGHTYAEVLEAYNRMLADDKKYLEEHPEEDIDDKDNIKNSEVNA